MPMKRALGRLDAQQVEVGEENSYRPRWRPIQTTFVVLCRCVAGAVGLPCLFEVDPPITLAAFQVLVAAAATRMNQKAPHLSVSNPASSGGYSLSSSKLTVRSVLRSS